MRLRFPAQLVGRSLIVAALLLIWETLPRSGLVDAELLPPFSAAAGAMCAMLGRSAIRADLLSSAAEIAAAFTLSISVGLLLGLALGESRRFADVMDPVIFFLFGIPKSIFLPLFILTLGIGFEQKVAFGVFSTALIVTMNAAAAVRSIRPEHLLVARSYAATRWQIASQVYLPSMVPVLLDGLRTALIFTITAVMLAEIYASRSGFGHRLADWGENFDMRQLLGGVLLVSIAAIVAKQARRDRAREMLALVGLDGFAERHPHELSGGMRQRVSIARGLVQDPPMLLMDEPFAALDEQTRMTMGDELLRIWSLTHKTIVFVTHSLTETVYLADEVLVFSARPGRIVDRIEVTLPRPRTYAMTGEARFAELRDRIWQQIRDP